MVPVGTTERNTETNVVYYTRCPARSQAEIRRLFNLHPVFSRFLSFLLLFSLILISQVILLLIFLSHTCGKLSILTKVFSAIKKPHDNRLFLPLYTALSASPGKDFSVFPSFFL
jgi:hypothetical protein